MTRRESDGVSLTELRAQHERKVERAIRILQIRIERRTTWPSIAAWAAQHGRTWTVKT